MANILDTIKKVVGGVVQDIKEVKENPRAAVGKLGRGIDWIGQKLGNVLPEFNVSEAAESWGGQPKQNATQEDLRKLEEKTKERTGEYSARGVVQQNQQKVENAPKNVSVDPNSVSNLKHERAMGANVGDVREFGGNKWRWNGEVWEPLGVSQPSSSQKNDDQIRQDIRGAIAQGAGQGFLGEDDVEKILNDVRQKGMDLADAIERRKIENAENRYRTMMDILGRQKGDVSQLAKEQREGAGEQEQFYKGEIEKRKQAELETIEAMKPEEEKNYQSLRDDTAGAYNEAVRRFQAAARASGGAVSGWTLAEEKRMLNEFNRNLSKISITHQETLQKINQAIKDTIDTYDSKIGELEFETKQKITEIDQWERGQISAIQNQEQLSLAQKFEEIQNAVNTADQLRLQVEQQYGSQKAAYTQWLQQLKVNMAMAAQAAAQDRIIEAQQLAEKQRKEALELQKWALSQGLYQTVPTGEGYKLYYYNPSSGKMEESGTVTPEVSTTLDNLLNKKTTPSIGQLTSEQIDELFKIFQKFKNSGGGSW